MPRPKKSDVQQAAQAEAAASAEIAGKPSADAAETRYSAASLRRNSLQLFQVNPEVVDGALYGTEARELTIAEAKSLIAAYLQREVH
ncbi:hypothetical protein [Paenibacillus harenae]|uniref:YqzN/YkzM domain-containing protein n=1 Tax=Paenibacillus harenae TaxID=306543 RepID=A0ABT9TZP2_PAEHA|nr:hypothetical protein [Paenibacillus harenae]MDQ0060118.1 hypothetical protein [Paenibacillus harenae]MDQ0112331.1 hypothetical protein [Paenibacillus harenae]